MLWRRRKNVHLGRSDRDHRHVSLDSVCKGDPMPKHRRVFNAIPRRTPVELAQNHFFHLKPILAGQDSVIDLRTELVESMVHEILGGSNTYKGATKFHHLHVVPDGLGEVKKMLETASV